MKRLKSCYLILVLPVCIAVNATGRAAEYQLIVDDVSLQGLSTDAATNLTDNPSSVIRSRYVSLPPSIAQEMNISAGDNIVLNLFSDAIYIAKIEKVSANINNTFTASGSIQSHPYSNLFISKTGNKVFVSINIPDVNKRFIIRSETETGGYLLMEIDSSKIQYKDGPSVLSDMNIGLDEMLLANNQFAADSDGPVSIDIMIVYTHGAYEDAGLYFGGVDNYIAYLMNEANIALEKSQIYASLNLVHSAMVDYVENKITYMYNPAHDDITEGSLYAALRHLGEKDSYMEEVLDWRDKYGADLVTLLVSNRILQNSNNIAGVANQLTNVSGNSNDVFSVIVTRFSNYTFIHELGHNMGCGHSKYQSTYNYGGLFSYSYGWRWANLCSIMSYPESDYIRIGIFSNPNILDYGLPAGDPYEADNARTIRQTMYTIADYRNHVDINDVNVPVHTPITIYVNKNAPSDGNGLSWDTAYKYLQKALLSADNGDEIRVAAGTYKPTDGTSDPNNRNKSFILKKGVSVYGGFSGNETKLEQRNFKNNKTFLSGDIGSLQNKKDNSLRIIVGAGDTVLDGFYITGSNGNDTFYWTSGYGGGIYYDNFNNIKIANCTFENNYSIIGSGFYISDCNSVSVINCIFKNNTTQHKGTVILYNSNIIIAGCEFDNNTADYSGGGLELHNCIATISNCLFINNSAKYGAGAEIWNSNVSVANCTFSANSAAIEGGAMENYSNTKIMNSIFWNNTGGEIGGNPKVNYSDIKGGWFGTGAHNINIDPLFADASNGDYHLKSAAGRWNSISNSWVKDEVTSPCIDAGDSTSDLGDELWPHGKRINMGAYGGTTQASMSLSNIGDKRDLNNDGLVSWDDVLVLAEKWESNDTPLKEDLDRNGIVNTSDLAYYSNNWEESSNNTPPELVSIMNKNITVNNPLSFNVSATDNDGDELVYIALGLPEGAEFSEQTFVWTPEQSGIYQVTFVVSDYKSMDYMTVKIIAE